MSASQTNGVFLARGGCRPGKGLLVLNGGEAFEASHQAESKSRKNYALALLAGKRGILRKNKAGTCFVLDLSRGGETLCWGTAKGLGMSVDDLNSLAREGKAWWCKTTNGGGCPSYWILASDALANRLKQ